MPRRLSPGAKFGPYQIAGLIGQGGMSVVYLATRSEGGERLALKVLSEDVARDADLRSRFSRESRYLSELEHPSIVAVRDSGEAEGQLYIAMDYIEGMDLRTLLSIEGRLAPERAVAILAQIADALDAAHAAGIVHRDVKPANIIVAEADRAFLADFGLSKNASGDSRALTLSGDFVGSLHYTAPEQIIGKPGDHRLDVYSLGCVLYECLTGEPPYSAIGALDVMYAHVGDEPPSLLAKRPDLPQALDGVIATAMAKDSGARHPSCGALIAAVRVALGEEIEVASDPPVTAQRAVVRQPAAAARAPALSLRIAVDAAAGVAVLSTGPGEEQARLTRTGSGGEWVKRP